MKHRRDVRHGTSGSVRVHQHAAKSKKTTRIAVRATRRMWKPEQRRAADRHGLRYPSDLNDSEWALIEPAIPPAKRDGRRREVCPTAAIIDSQSAKGAQKGAPRLTRMG